METQRKFRPRQEHRSTNKEVDEESAKKISISRNHEKKKEFIVAKFDGDGETEKFPMKSTTLDMWELVDGEEYGDTLEKGDPIHVKAPKATDPKRRRFPARVIFVTNNKEKAAAMAKKEGPRGKFDPKSPTKLREQRHLLDQLNLKDRSFDDRDVESEAADADTERPPSPAASNVSPNGPAKSRDSSPEIYGPPGAQKHHKRTSPDSSVTKVSSGARSGSSERSDSPATREAWKDWKETKNGTYDESGKKVYLDGEWLYRWPRDMPDGEAYDGPTQPGPDPRNPYSRADPSNERLWRHAPLVVPEGYRTPSSCSSSPKTTEHVEQASDKTNKPSSSRKAQKLRNHGTSQKAKGQLRTSEKTKSPGHRWNRDLFTPTPPKTAEQLEFLRNRNTMFWKKDWTSDVFSGGEGRSLLDCSSPSSSPDVRKKLTFTKSPKKTTSKDHIPSGIRDAMIKKKVAKTCDKRAPDSSGKKFRQLCPNRSESPSSSPLSRKGVLSGKMHSSSGHKRAETFNGSSSKTHGSFLGKRDHKTHHETSSSKTNGPHGNRINVQSKGNSAQRIDSLSYRTRTNEMPRGYLPHDAQDGPAHGTKKRHHNSSDHQKSKKDATGEQDRLARRIRVEFKTKGPGKTEIFPGAQRYVSTGRFTTFKTNWHFEKPLLDAVNFAMVVLGSTENILRLFRGNHVGLKTVLKDGVRDILAFVNGEHPYVKAGKAKAVTEKELITSFSRRAYYIRSEQKKDREQEAREKSETEQEDKEARSDSVPL